MGLEGGRTLKQRQKDSLAQLREHQAKNVKLPAKQESSSSRKSVGDAKVLRQLPATTTVEESTKTVNVQKTESAITVQGSKVRSSEKPKKREAEEKAAQVPGTKLPQAKDNSASVDGILQDSPTIPTVGPTAKCLGALYASARKHQAQVDSRQRVRIIIWDHTRHII